MKRREGISLETLDSLAGVEALCLFIGEDERPLEGIAGFLDWRLCGRLSRVLQDGFFKGEAGEWLLLPSFGRIGPQKVFAVGLGQRKALTAAVVQKALEGASEKLKKAKVSSVAVEPPGAPALSAEERKRTFKDGFLDAFGPDRVTVLTDDPS